MRQLRFETLIRDCVIDINGKGCKGRVGGSRRLSEIISRIGAGGHDKLVW